MPKTVLVVDDSTMARMLIRRCVEIGGWPDADFIEASNGLEAIKCLEDRVADLVLTDLNMPEMDGEELLRAIRADRSLDQLPVIVITSAGNAPKEAQLRELGASAILSKPISPAIMASTLENLTGSPDAH